MNQPSEDSAPEPDAPSRIAKKREAFRALHREGCFVLPNPWDVGSARLLQHLGFAALASTSAGYAWTTGRPDYGLPLSDVLQHLTLLCRAVDLPVNADFESGFAVELEALAGNVQRAIETGVAGLSLEDRDETQTTLYDTRFAVERVRAARSAIDRHGPDVILVARTEALLLDPTAVTAAIDKLVEFAAAGADCLYAPGVRGAADIAAMVRAVAPKPLNVLVSRPGPSIAELAELGVRRVSVGGALARVGWHAVLDAATELRAGSSAGLSSREPALPLNDIFGAGA